MGDVDWKVVVAVVALVLNVLGGAVAAGGILWMVRWTRDQVEVLGALPERLRALEVRAEQEMVRVSEKVGDLEKTIYNGFSHRLAELGTDVRELRVIIEERWKARRTGDG